MKNPKDKLAAALAELPRQPGSNPDGSIPAALVGDESRYLRDQQARLIDNIEKMLQDAKDGKVTQLVMVGEGPTGTTESVCVRGDEAARMVGLLSLTQHRLLLSLARMSNSRPLDKP